MQQFTLDELRMLACAVPTAHALPDKIYKPLKEKVTKALQEALSKETVQFKKQSI
ncbi:hypothetical protein GCM10028819_50030 [Spirosoma humi]